MTAVAQPASHDQQKPTRPMTTHEARGGAGLPLHVREWGRPDGSPAVPRPTSLGYGEGMDG
jgi:hypothetical protein